MTTIPPWVQPADCGIDVPTLLWHPLPDHPSMGYWGCRCSLCPHCGSHIGVGDLFSVHRHAGCWMPSEQDRATEYALWERTGPAQLEAYGAGPMARAELRQRLQSPAARDRWQLMKRLPGGDWVAAT